MSGWLWSGSNADEPIDKATSELLPGGTEDIALNLEICDQVRAKTIPAKDAMRALKRRLNHKNPNVQLLALGLADICVKNGGDHFLVEVASREFMDNLVSILRMPGLNADVKTKILRQTQNWSLSFEGRPNLRYVSDVYKDLQNEGFTFPPKDPAATSSAMVDTKTAPEWIDSEVCLRCRTPFTFTNRKHHCRNCGQVFDQQCSSKLLPLPHFGITQEVRVCDTCHSKLTRRGKAQSVDVKGTRYRNPREFEDAELQRAIQLSLQEVGDATGYGRPGYTPSYEQPHQLSWSASEPPLVDRSRRPAQTAAEEDDPDLRAAIEASLREAQAPRPSAPMVMETPRTEYSYAPYGEQQHQYAQSYPPSTLPAAPAAPALPNYDLEPLESDAILTFNQMVEQVHAQNRPDVARYPAVNELYQKAANLNPKLAMSVDDTDRKQQLLSEMHTKLSQAVKLYDNLLTQQVAQPSWQAQPAQPSAPYQQPQQPQATGYASYGQWSIPPVASPQIPTAGMTYAHPQSYAAAPPAPVSATYQQPVTQSAAYGPPPAHMTSAPPAPASYASHYASASTPSFAPMAPPAQAAPESSYAPQPAAPAHYAYPASVASPAPTPAQVMSPPPPPARAQVASPPPAQAYAPQAYAQYAPPQQLPMFPSAPTALPMVPSYGSPQPEQAPRKEVALIEL